MKGREKKTNNVLNKTEVSYDKQGSDFEKCSDITNSSHFIVINDEWLR